MTERKYIYRKLEDANFEDEPVVEGTIRERSVMTMPDKRKAAYLIIDTSDGQKRVWVSTGLEDLYKAAKVGNGVRIKYLGTTETKKNKKPFKQFAADLWSE